MIRSALVIGGGIAGPVAAMALQKAGIDAVVYEAFPSRADGAGGGLTLAPNGLVRWPRTFTGSAGILR
jgi:FAD-dependent urate hydroxylase